MGNGRPKLLDINIGDEFGDLRCINIIINENTGYTNYIMQCTKCGRTKSMLSSTIRLKRGITHKACGRGIKTKDPIFYDRWEAMRTRTTNPNYEHANCYIERGINSDEFENFIDFYDSMYSSFIEKSNEIGKNNTSLERIDPNGNYTKENCIWIHKNEQQGNQRKTVKFIVTFPDGHEEEHKNVLKFAKENNLDANTILDVMNPKKGTTKHKGYKFKRLN